MKLVMRLPQILASTAGLALVASLATAASAAGYDQGPAYRHQSPQSQYQSPQGVYGYTTPAPETGVPATQAPDNNCFYLNYNPNAPQGQGSGNGLGRGKLVCR